MLFIGCSRAQEPNIISGTKWTQKVNEEAYNYLIFKSDSSYFEYDCEMDEKYYGTYYLKNDSLILIQKEGEFDKEFSEKSKHRAGADKRILQFHNEKIIGYKKDLKYKPSK